MKQIIVMIAMIMLGIAIAGFVGAFKDTAKDATDNTNVKVKQTLTTIGAINITEFTGV